MVRNELSDSTTNEFDLEVKTAPLELVATSLHFDFIPLHMAPKPEIQNNNVPNEKNGQKRIQTAPIEAIIDLTSKKPRINTPEYDNIKSAEAVGDETDLNKKADEDEMDIDKKGDKDEMDQSSVTEVHYLTVNNWPSDWTYVQFKNYLEKECGHVDKIEILAKRAIRLTFQSLDKCSDVSKKLENKFRQYKKSTVIISDVTQPELGRPRRWRPDLDCLDTDPEGLYGLRPEFLKALGLQPPLNKKVHVTNFSCDKAELKEVMELAGNVLMCCVGAAVTKYAKIIYSHPLEAVQAISMLNGQMFNGTPLKITMDKNPEETVLMPKGLAGIGQGLGIGARSISNIVQQYHRYANKQTSLINPIIFSKIDFSDGNVNKTKTEENKNNDCEKIATKIERGGEKHNVGSPQVQTKNGAEEEQSNSPLLASQAKPSQGLMHPNMVRTPPVPMHNPLPMPGHREPFFRPGNPQERLPFRPRVPFMPPPMQRPPFPQPGPAGMRPQIPPTAICRPPRANVENCVTIKLSNMPPATTVPLLCDLLAQCGEVMAVRLTTPGCALATFSHPVHAESCFRILSQAKVVKGEKISIDQPN